MKTPDLIHRSGRERLALAERLTWLASDAVTIDHARSRLPSGAEVHTLGELLCAMRVSWPAVFARAPWYVLPYRLRQLSELECDVMAYYRGGARAVDRLRRERRELRASRDAALRSRLRWRYPAWDAVSEPYERPPRRCDASPWIDLGGEA